MPSRPSTAGAAARWSRFCGCTRAIPPALVARERNPETQTILRERYQALDDRLEPKNLNTNYRSDAAIVGFNNAFFEQVSQRHRDMALVAGIYDANFGQKSIKNKKLSVNNYSGKKEVGDVADAANANNAEKPEKEILIFNSSFSIEESGHVELLFTHPDAPAQPYQPATGTYAPNRCPATPPRPT